MCNGLSDFIFVDIFIQTMKQIEKNKNKRGNNWTVIEREQTQNNKKKQNNKRWM